MKPINAEFTLRPVFVSWIALLVQLPFQLFFTLWSGIFFGGMLSSFAGIHGRMPFILFGALAFIGVPLVAYVGKKLNYARTEYRFYADRVEFDEGFFAINRKIIKFADVKEVTLRKGILQRTCELGTIYLATLATGSSPYSNPFGVLGFGNVSASGVNVRDIPNPDDAYERIQKLVDARNH
jgi:membrane protein YdbS with pleckstrin-like domain